MGLTPGSPGHAGGGCTAQGFAQPPTVIPSTAMKGILGNALGNTHLFPCTSDLAYPQALDENVEENLFTIKQKGLVPFFVVGVFLLFVLFFGFWVLFCLFL